MINLFKKLFASKEVSQPQGLITVLIDPNAEWGDRDDAAMDLGAYDESDAESALLKIAADPETDSELANTCGESLGEIWSRKDSLNPKLIESLNKVSQEVAIKVLELRRPDWKEILESIKEGAV